MTCCTFYFLSSQSIFHVTPAVVAAKKEVSLLEGLSYNLDPHDLIHSGSVRSDYWVILQFTSSPEYWGFFFLVELFELVGLVRFSSGEFDLVPTCRFFFSLGNDGALSLVLALTR